MADKKKPVRPPSRTAGLLQLPVEGVPKMPQGLLSYEPTLREKIANAVYDGSVGLLGKRKAHEMQANTKSAVDFVPGLGDAVGANDMARDYRAGNYGMAALSAIGLIPAVGDVVSKTGKKALANAPEGIRAFHGSPHSFDKFSLDKIGTGEGAQAYGHGLYFADNEKVAKEYRDALAGKDTIPPMNARMGEIAKELRKYEIPGKFGKYSDPKGVELKAEYDALMEARSKEKGSMYEVNIRANPDDFLDWDKPLSEQPKAVQNALEAKLGYKPAPFPYSGLHGPNSMISKDAGGEEIYRAIGKERSGDKIGAADALREAGIPGIKYLDAGSRGAGDGSRNYVVFDEKLIDIVRKYGLASAIGAGIISKEMGQQMQAQGDI